MIGIDIEATDRFLAWTDKEYSRIFTKKEIEYAKQYVNPAEHLCGFFCVREALVKALNNTEIEYKKIEVLHTETGKPYINQTKYVKDLIAEKKLFDGTFNIEISISHCKGYATAVVLFS